MPPSTNNSTPFTKLESLEARNSATVATSADCPIVPRGMRDSKYTTVQALASEMADQAPGSEIVATRLAEVLFIQVLRAYIAAEPARTKGWLRAVFDPQIGTALSAVHHSVKTPWTVDSPAAKAGMSRSAFAARFKQLVGQTPRDYVTAWRMQKAMHLLKLRDRKLIDVARSVGYESDAAFSKAFQTSGRNESRGVRQNRVLKAEPAGELGLSPSALEI